MTTPTPETASETQVWDPLVRLFHWSLAAGFAAAYIIEDHPLALHVWIGYLILALIAIRVTWGFVGSTHARFGDFVRGPRATLDYLRDTARLRAPRHLGHNPAGGAMVVALLLTVSATGLSGLALYGAEEFAGPLAGLTAGLSHDTTELIEGAHEFFANLTLLLVLLHVAGVLFSSFAHQENLIGSMISGRKRVERQ
ncbi:cytochrome b/b6 domain-containing protein [Marichromatium gracile]|uniref:cytochrome b/b6 domain-containing protein n=1 Tax=Marichromatium gracile TaxID=1048 RepID=UPI001F4619F7|nr:cytochrome b/b6 domain-containing protein [Marichromatium gracile]MCF1183211.1 cytochrome b/b6 domain-containing protein [Marichromatium gracile]